MAKKKKEKKGEDATEESTGEASATTEGGEAGAEGAEGGAKKGKRKLIFIAGGVVLLLAIVGGLFAAGIIGGGGKEEAPHETPEEIAAKAEAAALAARPVYYELPEFLINLSATSGRTSFLKMSVTLELRDQAAIATMDASKPRIIDTFNTYLREMRPADLQGSAGIYRLRTELMARLNSSIEEGTVKDILFSEIIVQ